MKELFGEWMKAFEGSCWLVESRKLRTFHFLRWHRWIDVGLSEGYVCWKMTLQVSSCGASHSIHNLSDVSCTNHLSSVQPLNMSFQMRRQTELIKSKWEHRVKSFELMQLLQQSTCWSWRHFRNKLSWNFVTLSASTFRSQTTQTSRSSQTSWIFWWCETFKLRSIKPSLTPRCSHFQQYFAVGPVHCESWRRASLLSNFSSTKVELHLRM